MNAALQSHRLHQRLERKFRRKLMRQYRRSIRAKGFHDSQMRGTYTFRHSGNHY